jgi:hypothetical protein
MAIKISGTTVIDDDRNLVSTGIATIGTGSSSTTIDGVSGVVNIGTGVTINAVTGDINTIGIVTVGQLNVPIEVISFSPAIGATGISSETNIVTTFNQTVGFGTTGFIELKVGSATTGALIETLYPVNTTLSNQATVLTFNNADFADGINEIFPVMSSGFVVSNGSDFAGINTVGSATTYSFTTKRLEPGDFHQGGYIICNSGGTRWIVATLNTEVSRDWYTRADAVTTANATAACGDWFVPSFAQLQNPGYVCRNYWDSYSNTVYWSDEKPFGTCSACCVNFINGAAGVGNIDSIRCVRAFRCMTY